jgi:hypothetical protein
LAVLAFGLVLAPLDAGAQAKKRMPKKPDASQAASVSQTIGAVNNVTIAYHRPGIKGRDVWTDTSPNAVIGRLVPHDGDPRPWRAGANEATTITFDEDVLVEGKAVPAGRYGLFMIPTKGDWTIVVSKQADVWGSFTYKAEEDVLRVTVKPQEAPKQEWLMYGFDDPDAWSTTAYLHWDTKKIPFKIEHANKGEE